MASEITWENFQKVDIRGGTVLKAEVFEKAKKPAYKLEIDFGGPGVKRTSAQITDLDNCEELVGKQAIAVVNFPKKQIVDLMSEVFVLGILQDPGVILLQPDKKAQNGAKIA